MMDSGLAALKGPETPSQQHFGEMSHVFFSEMG